MGGAVPDLENVLGGELRLQHLAYAGQEKPHACTPEYEPLADQKDHVRPAAAPDRLGDDAGRGQDEQQQNNG